MAHVNDDGSLHVIYDDGDQDEAKDRGSVRPSTKRGRVRPNGDAAKGKNEKLAGVARRSNINQGIFSVA